MLLGEVADKQHAVSWLGEHPRRVCLFEGIVQYKWRQDSCLQFDLCNFPYLKVCSIVFLFDALNAVFRTECSAASHLLSTVQLARPLGLRVFE